MNSLDIMIMYSTSPPSAEHIQRLQSLGYNLRIIVADSEATARQNAPNTEIILGHRYLWQVLPYADSLKWVQSSAGGIDHLLVPNLWKRKPLLTRTPIFSDVIAWHALAMALALNRNINNKQQTLFNLGRIPKVALVFGLGEIGKELVTFLHGLGIKVIGVNRSGKSNLPCHQVVSVDNWQEYLSQIDWLFLCCPLTPETYQIINRDILNKLPNTASIINVGRGGLIDHSTLISYLEKNKLFGAAFDVIDSITQEQKQKLVSLPNVIITPKIASFCPGRQNKFEEFVESQVHCYLEKKPLLYLVEY